MVGLGNQTMGGRQGGITRRVGPVVQHLSQGGAMFGSEALVVILTLMLDQIVSVVSQSSVQVGHALIERSRAQLRASHPKLSQFNGPKRGHASVEGLVVS